MIVYCDLRRPPVFRDAFRESGVIQRDHFRNVWLLGLERRWPGRFLTESLMYAPLKAGRGDRTVIVFDSYTSLRYMTWLCRTYPDRRVILWFWNPVRQPDWLKRLPPQVEVWSYSKRDCERYGLRHNTQFFFDCLADTEEAVPAVHDTPPKALFIGREKGREAALRALADRLEAAGVETELRLAPQPDRWPGILHERLMPYCQTAAAAKQADILLDYASDPDAGMSLRPMEALFFGKKLITSCREVKEADFYDPANVYLLGEDDRSLQEFAAGTTVPVDPAVRDRYRLSAWLKRFEEGEAI